VNLVAKLKALFTGRVKPAHLLRGDQGEHAAEKHLRGLGLKFLARNFRSERGEIDLVFREDDCVAFVEVKTLSDGTWRRPAAQVDARKRRALSRTALDYLQAIENPPVKIRFDIVEVLVRDAVVTEIRHLPNTFAMTQPWRYHGPPP
jgi:putative endonuclease